MRYQDDNVDYYGDHTGGEPLSDLTTLIVLLIFLFFIAVYFLNFLSQLFKGLSISESHEIALGCFATTLMTSIAYFGIVALPIGFLYLLYKLIA